MRTLFFLAITLLISQNAKSQRFEYLSVHELHPYLWKNDWVNSSFGQFDNKNSWYECVSPYTLYINTKPTIDANKIFNEPELFEKKWEKQSKKPKAVKIDNIYTYFVYDNNGKLIEISSKDDSELLESIHYNYYDGKLMSVKSRSKMITYEYDTENGRLVHVHDNWSDKDWVLVYEDEKGYFVVGYVGCYTMLSGKWIPCVRFYYTDGSGWSESHENERHIRYEYDDKGRVKKTTSKTEYKNTKIIEVEEVAYKYDNYNRITNIADDYRKIDIEYLLDGKIKTCKCYLKEDNGKWKEPIVISYFYDAEGNIEKEIYDARAADRKFNYDRNEIEEGEMLEVKFYY